VIIEVLDARDPLGTRCVEIERQILQTDPKKKIVLVLNKIDLVSRQNLEEWLKVLRNELPTIAFKASTQQQRAHMGHHSHNFKSSKKGGSGDVENVTECLGASTLIGLLKNYARSKDMKMSISVGVIGIPNVGKSSLINSLKRERAVGVGSTPGFTKSMQEVVLDKNLKLLDCPGIVFTASASEAEAALRNAVKVEQLVDVIAPVELIIQKSTQEQLMEIYQLGPFENVVQFLTAVAKKRGKVKPGGIVDIDSAARVVIADWNGGKIPYMSRPPRDTSQIAAEIVPAWSEEFNIASIAALEAEHVLQQVPDLPSVQFVQLPESTAPKADAIMMSEDLDNEEEDEEDDEEDGEFDDEDEEDGELTAMDADQESDDEAAAAAASKSNKKKNDVQPKKKESETTTKKKLGKKSVKMEVEEGSDKEEDGEEETAKPARAPKTSKEMKAASKKHTQLEKKRKRVDKAQHPTGMDSDEDAQDDTYDFGADFWGKVPSTQVRGDAKASSSSTGNDFSDFAM